MIKIYNEHIKALFEKNILLKDKVLDEVYQEMLDNKYSFVVIENDKYFDILTKEKSIFRFNDEEKNKFISEYIKDKYYKTTFVHKEISEEHFHKALKKYFEYLNKYKEDFNTTYAGYLFGVVASRIDEKSFIVTIRGKKDLNDYATIYDVDHDKLEISVIGDKKPTPNSPLMSYIFKINPNINAIVMRHHLYNPEYKTEEFYPSGTYRDSIREIKSSININNHGSILLFDVKDNVIEKIKIRT